MTDSTTGTRINQSRKQPDPEASEYRPAPKKAAHPKPSEALSRPELLRVLERLARSTERLAQAAEQMAIATACVRGAGGREQGPESKEPEPVAEVLGVVVVDEGEEE